MNDYAMGQVLEYNEIDSEEKQVIDKVFDIMSKGEFKIGNIYFDGGGDSGEIYERIEYENGQSEDISDTDIMNFLYRWLGNFYGGWEINEGSHGVFVFRSRTKEVELVFNEHREDTEDIGTIFYAEF